MSDDVKTDQPIICVDLDGTLAEYTEWKGHHHVGEPINDAVMLLELLKDKGWKIVISTCRNNGMNGETDEELINITEHLHFWLRTHKIPYDYVATREMGKPFAHVYLDDRAFRWENNIGKAVNFCGQLHAQLVKSKESTKHEG